MILTHGRNMSPESYLMIFRCAIPVVLVYTDQCRKQISHNTMSFGIYF